MGCELAEGGVWVAVAGIVGVLAGAIVTGWFTYASKDEELRVHLVEIAIGILRADPKEDVAPARNWAISVIEENSKVKFDALDRAALLHKPISFAWDKSMYVNRPCGVIIDPLRDVHATTREGEERIAAHFERGAAAGCWWRDQTGPETSPSTGNSK
jgi:hypothetical protein